MGIVKLNLGRRLCGEKSAYPQSRRTYRSRRAPSEVDMRQRQCQAFQPLGIDRGAFRRVVGASGALVKCREWNCLCTREWFNDFGSQLRLVATPRFPVASRQGEMMRHATSSPTCLQDWGALQSTAEHSRAQRIDNKATNFQRVTTRSRAPSMS